VDQTLSKIAAFAGSKDTRLACGAAVVLAELAPREKEVVKHLSTALRKGDAARRPFMIEALGRIGTEDAANELVPLIREGGPSGQEALRAVAHAGSGALKPLARELKGAAPELLEKLAEAIARTGEPTGFSALIAEMRSVPSESSQAVRRGIRNAIPGLDAKGRQVLLRHLAKALETKAFTKEPANTIRALELIGDLGDPDGLPALVAQAGAKATPRIRATALRAIGHLDLTPARRGRLAGRLLPLLESSDFVKDVEPALAALAGAEIGGDHRSKLQKLSSSVRREVREFAMKTLATMGTKRNLKELIACLDDPDRSVREDAAEALRAAPEAAGELAEKMVQMKSGEACGTAARVLQGMADRIPPRAVASLATAFVKSATGQTPAASSPDLAVRREEDERRGALLSVCRSTSSTALAEQALKEARKLRASGSAHQALALLKAVAGVEGWGPEQQVEQSLAGLTVMPIDHSRAERDQNSNLRRIEELLSWGRIDPRKLARSILKDAALDRKIKYVLGHHFAERMQEERAFGKAVLEGLAENPRNEEGKRAREKLVLEGLSQSAKKGKTGLLEERAKILMAPADMAAKAAAEEEMREKNRARAAARKAKAKKKVAKRKPARKKTATLKKKKKSAGNRKR
jgi:HEAT repeat protein